MLLRNARVLHIRVTMFTVYQSHCRVLPKEFANRGACVPRYPHSLPASGATMDGTSGHTAVSSECHTVWSTPLRRTSSRSHAATGEVALRAQQLRRMPPWMRFLRNVRARSCAFLRLQGESIGQLSGLRQAVSQMMLHPLMRTTSWRRGAGAEIAAGGGTAMGEDCVSFLFAPFFSPWLVSTAVLPFTEQQGHGPVIVQLQVGAERKNSFSPIALHE